MTQLIAGFDAGQTHTTCRLARLTADGRWCSLADGEGSGVSHLAAPGGEIRFGEAMRSSLSAARRQAGLTETTPLAAAAIGASGIEAGSPVQQQGTALAAAALALPAAQVLVTGDERTALRGALGPEPGILLISGTGCIAVGQNRQGASHRCGGWGWLLDGAGSAMDIGRDGLAASLQMADGRLPETPLRAALWQALAASSPQAIKALVVEPGFGAAGFARLAPLVAAHAAAGDREAQRCIERSASALADLAATVARVLAIPAPAVCCSGGAITHLQPLREAFSRQLQQQQPQARLVAPAGDACDGALALAAAQLGDQAALRC